MSLSHNTKKWVNTALPFENHFFCNFGYFALLKVPDSPFDVLIVSDCSIRYSDMSKVQNNLNLSQNHYKSASRLLYPLKLNFFALFSPFWRSWRLLWSHCCPLLDPIGSPVFVCTISKISTLSHITHGDSSWMKLTQQQHYNTTRLQHNIHYMLNIQNMHNMHNMLNLHNIHNMKNMKNMHNMLNIG